MSAFADSLIGTTLGGYTVRRLIARGGMGMVFEGYQESLRRGVAIKVLYPHLSDEPSFRERFQREAQAIAQLRHPNIVRVIDYGFQGAYHFMVMELVNGASLRERLLKLHEEHRQMPADEALHIVEQVGAALAYAHARGYLHRDVKPGNIMLDEDGGILLSDFGLVKLADGASLTATGGIVGTPEYMAPEQALGENDIGMAADQYALGVVAYELFVGRVPFNAPTPVSLIQKHMTEPPPSPRSIMPWFPVHLESVLLRSLAKDPAARYASVAEFVAELQRAMDETTAPMPQVHPNSPGVPTSMAAAPGSLSRVPTVFHAPQPAGTTMPAAERTRVSMVDMGSDDGRGRNILSVAALNPDRERRGRTVLFAGVLAFMLLIAAVAFAIMAARGGDADDDGDSAAAIAATMATATATTQLTSQSATASDVVSVAATTPALATPTETPTEVTAPTSTATEAPTATATIAPSPTPTPEPTATPTAEPTATNTAEPTATPTATGAADHTRRADAANVEFDSGQLPATWQVVRSDTSRWSIAGGTLVVRPAPRVSEYEHVNEFLSPMPVLDADLRIIVKLHAEPKTLNEDFFGIHLQLGAQVANRTIYVGVLRRDIGPVITSGYVDGDVIYDSSRRRVAAQLNRDIFLMIERVNSSHYTAYFSYDGTAWTYVNEWRGAPLFDTINLTGYANANSGFEAKVDWLRFSIIN
jgi:serine/threonine-protein kinase